MNGIDQMNTAELAWFKRRLPRSYEKAMNAHTPTVVVENAIPHGKQDVFIEYPDFKPDYPKKVDMRVAAYERELRRIRGCLMSIQNEYDRVDELYQAVLSVHKRRNSKVIRSMLCDISGMNWSEIIAPSRFKRQIIPRQAGMYLYRKHTGMSYPQISKIFGRGDHSTAMNACDRVESRMWEFAKYVDPIEAELV
jgi:hypothetical protein